jgi:DNA mismatch repair protein MutS
MILDEYETYVKRYKNEYGNNTIVLLECGSFFEIYNDGSDLVDMKTISELLNIVVSRRNKSILEVSRNNFEMAGFPSHSLRKFINILLNANYTVVLVTQTTPSPNPKREVTEILSPGTNLEVTSAESNNLMIVYFEYNDRYNSTIKDVSIGSAIIDLSTGKSYVYETTSYMNDASYPYDELHRLIVTYKPREIELLSDLDTPITLTSLKNNVDFGNSVCIHDKLQKLNPELKRPSFQNEILKKTYVSTGILSPIEFVDMERRPLALVAFTRLVQFAFNHREDILNNIKKPECINPQAFLCLSYNTAQQLDIVSDNKTHSLHSILNNSTTAIGRRYFKHRLLNPLLDVDVITRDHDTIDHMTVDYMETCRKILKTTYDIERLFRKCMICNIQPSEFYNMVISFQALLNVQSKAKPEAVIMNIIEYVTSQINIPYLSSFTSINIEATLFPNVPKYTEIYTLQKSLDENIKHFTDIVTEFNNLTNSGDNFFKLESTDRDGYYISSTLKRYSDVLKTNPKYKDYTYKSFTSNVKITHPEFEKRNTEIIRLRHQIYSLCGKYFRDFIKCFAETFASDIVDIIGFVEYIDFMTTSKYNAQIYRLKRPVFVTSPHGYIKAKGLRHLLVENAQRNIPYVSNDVTLGLNSEKGMLLYGINSAGKSSLMKSIGIAVIMAQAGMYVSADALEISPYKHIFTRIVSSDDIFRGQSTFTKEIIELRNILRRADSVSLVIGDELCSGTESVSALSIVSAGIITLSARESSFIFATHLHDLVNIDDITNLKNVKIYHLSVVYDDNTKSLIYDRKLKSGNGSTLYGIEVCKSLDLDQTFLNLANNIRQKILGIPSTMLHSVQPSKYNSNVYKDICKVCNKLPASEVHHIKEQQDASYDGFIDTHHKNIEHNLIPLCESCHNRVHHGNLKISGYVQTSSGVSIQCSEHSEDPQPNVSRDVIIEYMQMERNNKKSKQKIYEELSALYGVSKYKIRKILTTSTSIT